MRCDDTKDACRRCGGTGYLPGYRHVAGGICFECGGGKYLKARGPVAKATKAGSSDVAKTVKAPVKPLTSDEFFDSLWEK